MLSEVKINNVRNIKKGHLKLSNNINIIVGPNGSGKTSVLEAIYLLSRSRSFRTQSINNVRTKGEEHLVVYGATEEKERTNQIAIKKSPKETKIRINGKNEKKASELSEHLKVHLIRPESQTLLERGSSARRTFIDWGVFHVKQSFLAKAKTYNHLLKQRNKLLKQRDQSTLSTWSEKLAEYGTIVDKERGAYLVLLQQELKKTVLALLGDVDISLTYEKGWSDKLNLGSALINSLDRDLFKGYTTVGPHKADIVLRVGSYLAQDYLSRGQVKLLVMALYLAQIRLLRNIGNQDVCVLVDDLSAELDKKNVNKVLMLLYKTGAQILLTATSLESLTEWSVLADTKTFHVEQGLITEGA